MCNINRDDASGFRLDTLTTCKQYATPTVAGNDILTTRTDFVNRYSFIEGSRPMTVRIVLETEPLAGSSSGNISYSTITLLCKAERQFHMKMSFVNTL